jgi:hypothetical protein
MSLAGGPLRRGPIASGDLGNGVGRRRRFSFKDSSASTDDPEQVSRGLTAIILRRDWNGRRKPAVLLQPQPADVGDEPRSGAHVHRDAARVCGAPRDLAAGDCRTLRVSGDGDEHVLWREAKLDAHRRPPSDNCRSRRRRDRCAAMRAPAPRRDRERHVRRADADVRGRRSRDSEEDGEERKHSQRVERGQEGFPRSRKKSFLFGES